MAKEFHVTYEKISSIPTVMQAGYATGLLFLCPLGDIARRRAFVLSLTWFTATMVSPICYVSPMMYPIKMELVVAWSLPN